jgi:hypothetical protein
VCYAIWKTTTGLQELATLARDFVHALTPLENNGGGSSGSSSRSAVLAARTCSALLRKIAADVTAAVSMATDDAYNSVDFSGKHRHTLCVHL